MQINKINQWLENIYKGVANQELLLLNTSQNHTQCNLSDLKRLSTSLTSNVRLLWLDGIQEVKYRYYNNQIVVVSYQDMRCFETLKTALHRDVIYVNDSDTINKIIALLQAKKIDAMGALKYTLLKKVEFEEVLKLDRSSLEEFILGRINLLKNIHYNFVSMEHRFFNDCLEIYYSKRILLASFAQYLYRLATLDFTSTEKSVGSNVHKTLGVKSKVISPRALRMKIDMSLLKNHRVYNLNENQVELDIKISIAKKLIELDIKGLDVTKIANITKLPIKRIEKIHSKLFFA